MASYGKIAQVRDAAALKQRFETLGFDLPIDDQATSAAEGSVLALPASAGSLRMRNRWCIHPMEGWDANTDGSPTELTLRRWERFGKSGAALIWGGEAAAVRPDGRANPHQTMAIAANAKGISLLRDTLLQSHRETYGSLDGLVVGLQLTHSGRFCKPNRKDRFEPRIAYHHPLLDRRCNIAPEDDSVVWTDAQFDDLIGDFVAAARLAQDAGYDFVDVKACHGYLLHELLSARARNGRYGGDLEGRTRLLLSIIREIQSECPGLEIGVRLSMFDTVPFEPAVTNENVGEGAGQADAAGTGRPVSYSDCLPYLAGFGCSATDPLQVDLDEPIQLAEMLSKQGVRMVNLTCGSPYYNPHIQRPAIFPPSDGYLPPEDPLVGVARQITMAARMKQACPELFFVGSGYTYLQDYLPHVAEAVVRGGMIDAVGLGRMVLSYPELPADNLAGKSLVRKLVCRTFSDCTTAPRKGLVSGCYPLDPFYKQRPERGELAALKKSE
jgi:NADPH2 dehydrogenase